MSDPENDKQLQKRMPKHTRLRYYTSFEEATIIKMWREHFHEIPTYTQNLQVFREISFGLQRHRIRLNKQEVRRRINNYRNRYIAEKNRMENDPNYKSEWRLYSLIDCMFNPAKQVDKVQPEDTLIEDIEGNIRQEIPDLQRFNRNECKSIKFEQDKDSCPFLEISQITEMPLPPIPQEQPTHVSNEVKMDVDEYKPVPPSAPEKRSPLMPANRTLDQFSSTVDSGGSPPCAARRLRRRSIMPRMGQITFAQIEELRKENELLAKQRDTCLAELKMKEQECHSMEETFDIYLHQQETLMEFLERASKL